MRRYIVNIGNKPFDYTLKQLYQFNISEYLCKRVIVEYWKTIDVDEEDAKEMNDYCIFKGEISCIGSNGQLRLQYIDILSPKSYELQQKYLPNPFHHSYWFSFKLIRKIYLIMDNNKQESKEESQEQLQDITTKLLNIIKFKIAQSFLFYCESHSISIFCKKNIQKFINKNYKYNGDNIKNEQDVIDMRKLKRFIKCELGHLDSNPDASLQENAKNFLNDLNRSNAHILFGEWSLSRNKQRSIMKLNIKILMKIVQNYICLWDDWIRGIEGNSFQKRRKKFIKIKMMKEKYNNYMVWDTKEVRTNSDVFAILNIDLETDISELYNTTSYDESGWMNNLRDARRIGTRSRYWPNRRKSQRVDEFWKYLHSREYINEKISSPFDRRSRRNCKKRSKCKKHNRKIARSVIWKHSKDEYEGVEYDKWLVQNMEHRNRDHISNI